MAGEADPAGIMIGLETHVQLNTQSKLFCGCANPVHQDAEPNTLTCPTCLGLPGAKPRVNERAIASGIAVGLGLGCQLAKEMFFSRKTYFYPDMSKNFQITQYEVPLAAAGSLEAQGKAIRIRRVHLEEDPARLVHGPRGTLADYNRSGVPLLEIVTEPDFRSPAEARAYLQKLELILAYLGVAGGIFKSDANISLHGGERVEVKNITGTKEIEQALSYEIVRQSSLARRGQKAVRETRAWNPDLKITQEMRGKEGEAEYGYIFEPDLTRITLPQETVAKIKATLPELPDQRYARFLKHYALPPKVAESLVSDLDIALLFEQVAKEVDPKVAGTWLAGYLKKTLNYNELSFKASGLQPSWIVWLLQLFVRGGITDRNAEMAIRRMVDEQLPPQEIIQKHGLAGPVEDPALLVRKVVEANPRAVEDFRKGEAKALNYLVGEGIKASKGRVDAATLRKLVLQLLE